MKRVDGRQHPACPRVHQAENDALSGATVGGGARDPALLVQGDTGVGQATVREISSSPLIVATPGTTVDECMALMTDRRIRHVPIVDGGEVVGIVSIGDLVKFRSELQSFEIRYLTEYISAH